MSKAFPFVDKNGKHIDMEDVLYDGSVFWRPGYNDPTDDLYLISCEKGYLHGLTQEMLSQYINIGQYDEWKAELFHCD